MKPILLILFLLGSWVRAEDIPPSGQDILPVDQIKPGMTGLTYTVLKGSEIVALKTEILGVGQNQIGPGIDMIIGKLVDDRTSLTGAVHGMSGSPLFVQGKLVGALSYQIAEFGKDGHCGFTPIAQMLKVKDIAENPAASADLPLMHLQDLLPPGAQAPDISPLTVPLTVPLGVNGLPPEMIHDLFQRLGLKPNAFCVSSSGGSLRAAGAGAETQNFEPKPGAPLAAVLMSGDISFAGTGTCTWRQGQRVVAFGHPMFGDGGCALALAGADIITTIPSYQMAYKLSNTGPLLGTVDQDRTTAISGLIGPLPPLAPYRIERTHNGRKLPDLTGQFVPHPQLTPVLIGVALESALNSSVETARALSVRMNGEVDFADHPALQLNGLYSGEGNAVSDLLGNVIMPMMQLYRQNQTHLQAIALHVAFQSRETADNWTIESVRADATRIEPGTPLHVTVNLHEAYGARSQKEFTVQLPENLRSGTVTLRVGSAPDLDDGRLSTQLSQARDVDEMIRLLNQRREADQLYLQVISRGSGEVVRDREMPLLPASILAVMQGSNATEETASLPENICQEMSLPLSGVVQGREEIEIGFK